MFLKLYEELSELNEGKADTQRLVAFAGEDLANRFLSIKNKLKSPENDLYYWIKNKTPEELEQFIIEVENTKSRTQLKKDIADEGAELVAENKFWRVYYITTFKAAQKYGRDTKWCITGVNNYGDKYWKYYTRRGIEFYFLIAKANYSSRGRTSKYAIAYHTRKQKCEVFNQQDDRITLADIPLMEDIVIPDVKLVDIEIFACTDCGCDMYIDEIAYGPEDTIYCDSCFDNRFSRCDDCGDIFTRDRVYKVPDGDLLCQSCFSDSGYEHCEYCSEIVPNQRCSVKETACGEHFCSYCFWDDYIPKDAGRIDRLALIAEYENFQDFFYESDKEQEVLNIIKDWCEAKKLKKITKYTEEQIEDLELNFIKHVNSLGIPIDATDFE